MTLTELTRRERKKEETRRRIFEVAIALFRERGFEATTVDEITERADVGRGTFFNYFPRKEAVLAYLSEERVALAEENAAALLDSQAPAREKLHDIYAFAASAYLSDRELSRFVFEEWMRQAFAPTEEAGSRWQALVLRIVEQGQTAGALRTDVPAIMLESLLSSVYMTTLYYWLCSPVQAVPAHDFPLLEGLRQRIDLVMDGVATKGGRA
ncbi:MAG: TetR/AcrR family transcriptional regulator [Candidatus Eisenbacteria bacterium]|nr:TetR/AcrR family transcriptional regulator [Candidatus Eisenbacteria bacterium]